MKRLAAVLALSAAAASAQEEKPYTLDTWVLGDIQASAAKVEEGPVQRMFVPYARVRRALPGMFLAEYESDSAFCVFIYKGAINATPVHAIFSAICRNNDKGHYIEQFSIPVGTNGIISLRCSYFAGGERPAIDIKVQEMRALGDATLDVKLVPGTR